MELDLPDNEIITGIDASAIQREKDAQQQAAQMAELNKLLKENGMSQEQGNQIIKNSKGKNINEILANAISILKKLKGISATVTGTLIDKEGNPVTPQAKPQARPKDENEVEILGMSPVAAAIVGLAALGGLSYLIYRFFRS